MAEDDDFESELGIQSVQTVVGVSQREFGLWEREGGGDKDQLIERLGPAFLKLMDAVTIARSRRHVEKHYREDLKRIGGFPEREPPENKRPHTDENGELSYAEIHRNIGQYGLSVYSPSKYLLDKSVLEAEKKKYNFHQLDREGFLIEMMRVNLLKRLESSVESFRQTLSRMIAKMRETEDKIRRFQQSQSGGEIDSAPEDDPEDDEFFVGRRRRYNLRELDGAKWAADLAVDRGILEEILVRAEKVDAERDEKLRTLKEILRKKAKEPNRKALVFTHYADTARYLRDNLLAFARANKLKIAMVVGAAAAAPAPDAKPLLGEKTEDDSGRDFAKILDDFAPVSRGRAAAGAEIDILIATDCVSEGQNLQDCDMVVNYDIHWNPVRIIQRFGRVDRIGSRAQKVRMTNFWPAMEMEEYLKLESRVKARMALADVAATGHDDLLAAQAKNLEGKQRRIRPRRIDLPRRATQAPARQNHDRRRPGRRARQRTHAHPFHRRTPPLPRQKSPTTGPRRQGLFCRCQIQPRHRRKTGNYLLPAPQGKGGERRLAPTQGIQPHASAFSGLCHSGWRRLRRPTWIHTGAANPAHLQRAVPR